MLRSSRRGFHPLCVLLLALGCSPAPVAPPPRAQAACARDADCPAPPDACHAARCLEGACTAAPRPAGTPLPDTTRGDCKRPSCGEAGELLSVDEPSDVPPAAPGVCTANACEGGAVVTRIPAGEACSPTGFCSRTGACMEIGQITAGNEHACALAGDGRVWCWGTNAHGEATGTPGPDVRSPQPLPWLSEVRAVDCGDRLCCALRAKDEIACWGMERERNEPVAKRWPGFPRPVPGLGKITMMSVHRGALCVVGDASKLVCRFQKNGVYQEPVWVRLRARAVKLSASNPRACAVLETGDVQCLSSTTNDGLWKVTEIAQGLHNVRDLALEDRFGCVLRDDGKVGCWGLRNNYDMVTTTDDPKIFEIGGLFVNIADATALATTPRSACVLLSSGKVQCWGQIPFVIKGELMSADLLAPGIEDAVAITHGPGLLCARRRQGSIVCIGGNDKGQAGRNDAPSFYERPALVSF